MKNIHTYIILIVTIIFLPANTITESNPSPLFTIDTHSTLHYLKSFLNHKPTDPITYHAFLAQFLFEECHLHDSLYNNVEILKQRTHSGPTITYDELLCANAIEIVRTMMKIPSNHSIKIERQFEKLIKLLIELSHKA